MDIIVSHYNENLKWISNLTTYNNFYLYSKGTVYQEHIKLKNIGRESHTYFYHIVNNYDNLSDWSFFVQGNPFDHEKRMIDIINNFPNSADKAKQSIDSKVYFFCSKHNALTDNEKGLPHHRKGLEILKIWNMIFLTSPPKMFTFTPGCQFVAHKDAIQRVPKKIWEKLLKISEDVYEAPWIFERILIYVLNKDYEFL